MHAIIKPQYVDQIPRAVKGTVQGIIDKKRELDNVDHVMDILDLNHVTERSIADLSGGELQRFAMAIVCIQEADVYMFDEPSSYLDVKQRLKAGVAIRGLLRRKADTEDGDDGGPVIKGAGADFKENYIICVEHDLSILDYLSDYICCLYGIPGAYGVVTMPFSCREGINIFLDGFVPTENLRFRQQSLSFKVSEQASEEEIEHHKQCVTIVRLTLRRIVGLLTVPFPQV